MIRTLILCWVVIILIGVLFIWQGPRTQNKQNIVKAFVKNEIQEDSETSRLTVSESMPAPITDPSLHASTKEMLFSKQSAVLYGSAVMTIISGFFVVNQAKNFGVLNGLNNDKDLSLIASIGALFDVMRFLWSWWLDYASFKRVFGTLIAAQIFLNFTILIADKNWYSYALWVWLFMFCQGGVLVLMPNVFKRIYGSRAIAVYGFFGSFVSMTSLL